MAVFVDRGDFDDGHVDRAEVPEPRVLRDVAQVQVDVLQFARIDALAQHGVRLVGQAQLDAFRARQRLHRSQGSQRRPVGCVMRSRAGRVKLRL
ncbi:hypothetical protein J2X04_000853 [Lysobacter niabensis]|uniref:Uncharacterized protein n=1 Tax=Agrilutibacter niabensis TaxID=380628 RepID=A0ABU1VLY9_9GAMM|nr:hypothetical protein [Lysobacter niabensis]